VGWWYVERGFYGGNPNLFFLFLVRMENMKRRIAECPRCKSRAVAYDREMGARCRRCGYRWAIGL
jgi:tRNA(Ile2) C34 agmatinyltransferase TiaS